MKGIWRMSAGVSCNYTLTPQMFSINILCFMSNFGFKGDTLYRLIPTGGYIYSSSRIVLWGDTISWDTGSPIEPMTVSINLIWQGLIQICHKLCSLSEGYSFKKSMHFLLPHIPPHHGHYVLPRQFDHKLPGPGTLMENGYDLK